MQREERDEYLDEQEEQQDLSKESYMQNFYELAKYYSDPEARSKFINLITKDLILSNINEKDRKLIYIYADIYIALDDISKIYPKVNESKDIVLSKIMMVINSSRGLFGFERTKSVSQLIEQRKYMKSERERKEGGGFKFPFFKKKKRYGNYGGGY